MRSSVGKRKKKERREGYSGKHQKMMLPFLMRCEPWQMVWSVIARKKTKKSLKRMSVLGIHLGMPEVATHPAMLTALTLCQRNRRIAALRADKDEEEQAVGSLIRAKLLAAGSPRLVVKTAANDESLSEHLPDYVSEQPGKPTSPLNRSS